MSSQYLKWKFDEQPRNTAFPPTGPRQPAAVASPGIWPAGNFFPLDTARKKNTVEQEE